MAAERIGKELIDKMPNLDNPVLQDIQKMAMENLKDLDMDKIREGIKHGENLYKNRDNLLKVTKDIFKNPLSFMS